MKFSDTKYMRPNLNDAETEFDLLVKSIETAISATEQIKQIQKINDFRNHFESMMTLASINYSLDSANEKNVAEQDFFDENSPRYQNLINKYYKAILASKYRAELEKEIGKQLFSIADLSLKTFNESVMPFLQQENKLCSEYTKLLASAKITFDGKELNLSQLDPYLSSTERAVRKNANAAKYSFFEINADSLDSLFDELVKTRNEIAKQLGFKNFVELGYARMLRSDYNAEMVKSYRNQIAENIVPVASELRKKQAKRIGLDTLYYYDEPLYYLDGNANPKGEEKWIVNHAKTMYKELSKETETFFNYMIDNELMDLTARKGKATGGYCTYIPETKSPYIFSNFNGTTHDIVVLTHEAGHAFQCFESRSFTLPEYNFPTYEACEIHSMSMEFLTYPWMHLFFEETTEKFMHSHICKALQFLPYGAAVDEFQHIVYEKPNLTSKQRREKWLELEKKYVPHKDNEDCAFLNSGGFWQQQRHIYESPFYYIDYTLAQVCAFEFWKKASENRENAWKDYLHLCKKGGSKSFLELVKDANLTSPFKEGLLKEIAVYVQSELDKFKQF